MDQAEFNKTLKKQFEDAAYLTKEHKERIAASAKQIFDLRKQKVPIETKFVDTEMSRYKVILLKDSTIIINELKEDQAKSLFDKICQLT